MTDISYHHPIRYPNGWAPSLRSSRGNNHSFPPNLTIDQALGFLTDELKNCNFEKVEIFSNYKSLNIDRNRSKTGDDQGVSVRFEARNNPCHMACDKWQSIEQNLYALHLALRQFRQIEQWGIATVGYMASLFSIQENHANSRHVSSGSAQANSNESTTASQTSTAPWMEVLGLNANATLDDANAVYRSRAKTLHNDADKMLELNQAIDRARKYFANR